MTTSDDNNRLIAGTLPNDPEADAEPIGGGVATPSRPSSSVDELGHEDEFDADGTDEYSFDELDDVELDSTKPPPGLETPKLRPDDPRLAVPQPQLTRWRRGYVLGGLAAIAAVLVASVTLAANRGPERKKRDERLELYAHPGGGVPEGISKLTALGPARPAPSEPPASEYDENGLTARPSEEEAYEGSDDEDTSYEELPSDDGEDYGGGPRSDTSQTQTADESENDDLPPMAMQEAKGSPNAAALPRVPGGAGLSGLDRPSRAGAPQASALEQRESAPVDDDDRKERFMAKGGGLPDLSEPLRDRALCELDAGTPIQAYLETAINTDLPGQGTLKATVTKAVLCGPNHEYVAIPQGATLSGSSDSRIAYGQTRVLFCWHRLYLPKSQQHPQGAKKDIRCVPGAEPSGEIGLEGDVDNHWAALLGGVAISTFLSLGTSVSAGNQTGYAPTIGQQLARGAGQNIAAAGDRIAQRELMRKPTVRQEPTSFALLLNADMELEPFEPL